MFNLDRFIPVPGIRRVPRARGGRWLARRRRPLNHAKRIRTALPALCGVGVAAAVAWMLAGGSLPSFEAILGQPAAVASSGSAHVHLDSTPSGTAVRIDGAARGKTPLDTWLSPGEHALILQHPDALDYERHANVPEAGASLEVGMWRRRPDVVPLRPVYPGASLVDARFVDGGQVAMLVDTDARSGATGANRELWRLDAATGQLSQIRVPGVDAPTSIMVLAPGGQQVAYVTPGSASAVTASLWPINGRAPTAQHQESRAESVWVAPLDGTEPSRRIFELPSAGGPGPASDPERIVDVVWTPDGSRLTAITRQSGPPARSRVFLLNVAPTRDAKQPVSRRPAGAATGRRAAWLLGA